MNQALNQRDMFFKWLYYAGATLLLVLVQSLVLNRICVWGVHPFLPPLIAAITAMLERARGPPLPEYSACCAT